VVGALGGGVPGALIGAGAAGVKMLAEYIIDRFTGGGKSPVNDPNVPIQPTSNYANTLDKVPDLRTSTQGQMYNKNDPYAGEQNYFGGGSGMVYDWVSNQWIRKEDAR
jgi:hypothetical protein